MGHPKGKTEDRVFGMAATHPAPTLASHVSQAIDLFSTFTEGAETVYACEGPPANPPLLFVHGWAASHKFWLRAFTAFSPRYRCLAPDLVGFGLSEKPDRDYSMEAYARWLGAFLDSLQIDRLPVVAHSMGGMIALLFALEHPERVERLVLVNPVIQGPTAFPKRSRFLSMPVVRRIVWCLGNCGPFRRMICRILDKKGIIGDELTNDIVSGTFQSTFSSIASMKRTDLLPRLESLKVPTYLIGTDCDRVVFPSQQELLPAARREILEGCDHIPMLEKPAEFNRIVDEFLRERLES